MLKKIHGVILGIIFISLLPSCNTQTSLTPLQSNDVIVAFGDSLTVGYGVSKAQSYPAVLAKLTGLTVINAGVSGETTAGGLTRLPKILAQHKPKLVVLLQGGNDVLHNQPFSQIRSNLHQMIDLIKQSGAEVLLVSVPSKNPFTGSLNLYANLANELAIPLEDDIVSSLIRNPAKKSDYIHFNVQGYNDLAQAIHLALQNNGAVQ